MENLKILLVRHGESEANTKGYVSGGFDTPLSEKGKSQANTLGYELWLNKINIDAVYSSELSRAKETAESIRIFQLKAKECKKEPIDKLRKLYNVNSTEKLNEMSFGQIEGVYFENVPKIIMDEWHKYGYPINSPGQETTDEVVKRAIEGISEIAEKEKGSERICIVSHGMLIRLLTRHYKGEIKQILKNASYIEIEYNYDTKEIIFK